MLKQGGLEMVQPREESRGRGYSIGGFHKGHGASKGGGAVHNKLGAIRAPCTTVGAGWVQLKSNGCRDLVEPA